VEREYKLLNNTATSNEETLEHMEKSG